MGDGWMKASGSMGIPQAFIIDNTGHIAFIGHPEAIETALNLVLSGSYDLKVAASSVDWEQANMKEEMALTKATRVALSNIEKALDAKDNIEARKLINLAEASCPELRDHPTFTRALRFRSFAVENPVQAKAILEEGLNPNSTTVDYWGRVQALRRQWDEDKQWADLALQYVDRMAAKDPFRVNLLAHMRFQALLRVDRAKALTTLQASAKSSFAIGMALDVAEIDGLESTWYETIVPILVEGTKDDHLVLASGKALAATLYRLRRFKEAVNCQMQVVEYLKKDNHQQNGVIPAEKLLEKYRASIKE